MRKYFIVVVLLVFMLFLSGCELQKNKEKSINVYSWGEFISDGADGTINVNKKFTEETGIKVNYKTFQNNEELFAKISGGGGDYDVIIPSDYMVSRLIEKGMLEKIDFNNIPNYRFISDKFKNLNFDPKNEYSVPYVWGMIGIFYSKSEVSEEINWDILWNEKYKNRILMFDNARDAFAISLLRLGYSVNTEDKNELRQAADELIKQKPLVQAYVMDQIFDKISNGEAVLAPYYAGDAAIVMKNNPDIGFIIPKKGSEKFIDSMCIPKGSENKELAQEYINFMCRTDIALANAKKTGYSTPHKAAYNLLDEDIKNNDIFYPDKETFENSQTFVNLSEATNKLLDELWTEVKSGGTSENPWNLMVILLSFGILYLLVVILKSLKHKKQ